jgi:hypothetical protein
VKPGDSLAKAKKLTELARRMARLGQQAHVAVRDAEAALVNEPSSTENASAENKGEAREATSVPVARQVEVAVK